jgi:hypothetical protein
MRSKKLVTFSANVNYITVTDYKCYLEQSRNTIISPPASISELEGYKPQLHISLTISLKESNTIKSYADPNLEAAATKKKVVSFVVTQSYSLTIDAITNSERKL